MMRFFSRVIIGLWLSVLIGPLGFAQQVFNVKTYGATGIKDANATEAIQKAIDACAAAGGGMVYIAPGAYTIATITLKSNVNLHLEAGATLYASRNPADYKFTTGIYSTESDVPVLLYAENQHHISLTGKGTIDGQAEHTYEALQEVDNYIKEETQNAQASGIEMKRYYAKDPKVRLVYFIKCDDLTVTDISIINSPNWTLHIGNSERVNIRGIYIFSDLDKGVNADGIDIDGCRHVKISDCTIICGDDAICLKSTSKNGKYADCENITVTNCTTVSTSTALKIGTESHGNFRNIIFNNCTVANSNRGLGIFVRDGATVENVMFSNIVVECKRKHFNWWGDGDPIHVVLQRRRANSRIGKIRNISFQNIMASGEGTSLIASNTESRIEGISFSNVKIRLNPESKADKRATHILDLQAIDGVSLRELDLTWNKEKTEPKWQSGLNVLNCTQVRVEQAMVEACPVNTKPAAVFTNITGGHADDNTFPGSSKTRKGVQLSNCKDFEVD